MLMEVQKKRRQKQRLTWWGLPLVAVLGWFHPWLGFLLLVCMAGSIGMSVYRGRAWCNWMCPRGAFYDLLVRPLSRNKPVPAVLRSRGVRLFMIGMIAAMISTQWYLAHGNPAAMGLALVRLLTITTVAGIILGIFIHPRAWCHICPVGTLGRWLGEGRKPLFISGESCAACGACSRSCPMQLTPHLFRECGIMTDSDCIKCGSCVAACPRRAISFDAARPEKGYQNAA
ncbi:4Fe-4S binding protein [Desulfotomaculum copahuensis]|uniref:4Fe-4S binding protein n=1 Tax=Desulfotomaculum copahuensis TaxID=1838280 RepID=A0A1B7LGJ4_9FIRM|nr:4Fe-4S binding protein [Desulfotomaculum copahuensis]OAT85223.1 4Fe-4S binding protein [Desulfotomaculum copahuensis]